MNAWSMRTKEAGVWRQEQDMGDVWGKPLPIPSLRVTIWELGFPVAFALGDENDEPQRDRIKVITVRAREALRRRQEVHV